ncbi:MAG: hypothetical protein COA57_15795 [Flavobacteriales bacterium]|nr:MAG: hypothetical protein COA57_15795 [Flavobacteriales bacterium]
MIRTMFEQVKAKKYRYMLWIFFQIVSTLLMISAILFCKVDENNPWTNFLKIFPPLILASGIYLWQQGRYYFFVFRKYNGTVFCDHPKRKRVPNPEKKELITFKNRILYRNRNKPSDEGEIVLDLINLRYGKGFHNIYPFDDKKNENINTQESENIQNADYANSDQFGFSQFIVTKDKIFVEHPYIKPKENNLHYGEIFIRHLFG